MSETINLDYAANVPFNENFSKTYIDIIQKSWNPNSGHKFGIESKKLITESAEIFKRYDKG